MLNQIVYFLQFYGQKNHLNILGKFVQQILNISENILCIIFIFRTTNAAESFHRTFNRQFYCIRPPIYAVIQTLLETQEETSLKLNTIQQGTVQKASKVEEEKISKTIQSYINYCQ